RSDGDCREGQVCKTSVALSLVTPPGTCVARCQDDSQCDPGSRCLCEGCYPNGCLTNDDCGEGTYCPNDFSLICTPTTCAPLPPPVTCGTENCSSMSVRIVLGSAALAACCPVDTPAVCGFDVSYLSTRANSTGCQAPNGAGSSDEDCPMVSLGFIEAPGC